MSKYPDPLHVHVPREEIEPNEAEMRIAEQIYALFLPDTEDVITPDHVAKILAAHRAADDGELAKALEETLEYLPDSSHGDDWDWCWDELFGTSQDKVKEVRQRARAALARRAGKGEK